VPVEAGPGSSGEQDIFETDFEVPALDEESGSEAVALDDADTDLESSEFDLALGEEDMAADEESGSQVVALEDEEGVDEGAETVQRPAKKKAGAAALEDEDVDQLVDAEAEDDEAAAPARAPAAAAVAAPAVPWGPAPALMLLPCVVFMLLAGLMGYEMIHTMWGYKQPGKVGGFLTEAFARQFYDEKDFPKSE
jgi:hypothetical protein